VEQLGSWPVSSFLGADTDAGRVVMKASPSLFAHEPALTQAIHAAHPGSVPSVLAIDVDRRLLLMDAFGGSTLGAEDAARWAEGLVAMAGIQRAWVGRRADATAVGVVDRSLAALDAELESLLTDEAASPGLDGESRDRLIANLPRYRESIARLQDGPVPETLIHGDFHPWNVQRDGDRLLIFDWSDACWSHPFFDVRTCTTRTEDGAAQASMESAYLESWSGYADHASLRDALRLAAPLTELHLSISWQRLMPIFEPGVYRFVDTGVQRHLELALAATDPTA
jgi:aminoglycoside/choline kinase family phosphotransferase